MSAGNLLAMMVIRCSIALVQPSSLSLFAFGAGAGLLSGPGCPSRGCTSKNPWLTPEQWDYGHFAVLSCFLSGLYVTVTGFIMGYRMVEIFVFSSGP